MANARSPAVDKNGRLLLRNGRPQTLVAPEASVFSIVAVSADKPEGNAGGNTPFTFEVRRGGSAAGAASVNIAVRGTGANDALPGDFAGAAFPTATVSWANNDSSPKPFTAQVVADGNIEADKSFEAYLTLPIGGNIDAAAAAAPGVIRNDDSTSVSVFAVSANKNEGTGGTNTVFTFEARRTGALNTACSVQWAVTGSAAGIAGGAQANDFLGGVLPSGTCSWIAGNGDPKPINVTVVADSADESTEIFRVTIFNPTGCLIGTASVDGTIINDDGAGDVLPPGAVPDLAFNGFLLGTPVHDGEPGNAAIRNRPSNDRHAMVFYLESLEPIIAVQSEVRVDHYPQGSTVGGYSDRFPVRVGGVNSGGNIRYLQDGDPGSWILQDAQGGDLTMHLARVSSADGVRTLTLDPIAGSSAQINRVALNNGNWDAQYRKARVELGLSNTGSPPNKWMQFPWIFLETPIRPRDLNWQIGDRIAIIWDNSAPDNGESTSKDNLTGPFAPPWGQGIGARYFSFNGAFRKFRPATTRSTYRYMQNAGFFMRTYQLDSDNRFIPTFRICHKRANGTRIIKGNPYLGYPGGGEIYISAGNSYRQIFRIPNDSRWTGRKISGCDISVWKSEASNVGSFTLEIRKHTTGVVGGASVQGAAMTNASNSYQLSGLAAAGNNIKDGSVAETYNPFRNVTIPPEDRPEVTAGDVYYFSITNDSASGARLIVSRVLTFLRPGTVGDLGRCDHEDLTTMYQRRTGSGSWIEDTSFQTSDEQNFLMLGCSMHFQAP